MGTPHQAVFAQAKVQRVMQVDEAEQGLQQVIAVGTSSVDVQEQVQLGGCGTGEFHQVVAEINSSLTPLAQIGRCI
jgi:hypothetical protein